MEQKWIGRGFHSISSLCRMLGALLPLSLLFVDQRKNIHCSLGQMDGFILEQVQQNVSVVVCNKEQSHEIILTNRVLLRSY